MDEVKSLLEAQPLFALFLTIALGYLMGEISIKGFSLGSGAVLFVGLAIGGMAPKAAPPAMLGTMGLLLFPMLNKWQILTKVSTTAFKVLVNLLRII